MSRRQTYFGHLFDSVFGDDAFQRHVLDAKAWIVAHLLTGATNGLTVGQHCVGTTPAPNLTVDVSPGVAYMDDGSPATLAAIANVDCSADHLGASTDPASGNHLVASIFVKWADVPSDPFTDHAGASGYQTHDDGCTFEVWKGTEVAISTPASGAPLMAGYVLLADVTLTHGMTQIVPGSLHLGRRQNLITASGSELVLNVGTIGTAFAQLVTWLDEHLAGANYRHPASDVDGAGVYGTPYSLGYVGTVLVGGTVQSFLASLLGDVNALYASIAANVANILNQPKLVVDRSASLNVASGATVPLTWQVVNDPYSVFDSGHVTRLIAGRSGYYHVEASADFDGDGTITTLNVIGLGLYTTTAEYGSQLLVENELQSWYPAVTMTTRTLKASTVVYLLAGEYAEVQVTQTNASAKTATTSRGRGDLTYIGP